MKKLRIPAYVEYKRDVYRHYSQATVAQWRAQKKLAKDGGRPDDQHRVINHLLKLADSFGISDDVPLVPRLSELGELGSLN
jgi:hypothetical protein